MSTKAARLEYLKAVAELSLACQKFDRAIQGIAHAPTDAEVSDHAGAGMLDDLGPRKPMRRVVRAADPLHLAGKVVNSR